VAKGALIIAALSIPRGDPRKENPVSQPWRCGAVLGLLSGALVLASPGPVPGAPLPAGQAAPETEGGNPLEKLQWQHGPLAANLGDSASIQVPEGYVFLSAADTRTFMEINENPTSGNELGLIMPASEEGPHWFAVFEFHDSGYIKDDEKDALDADAILANLREGNESANTIRRERGWSTLEIVGWETPPHYDTRTQNLTWAIRGKSSGGVVINHSTRLLGRRGYTTVDLVLDPEALPASLPRFETILGSFSYEQGQRYAEFTAGDKIATYGLTALIAGGVGAAAVKSGLLGKFWKLIAVGVLAVVAFFRKLAARIFRKSEPDYSPPQV